MWERSYLASLRNRLDPNGTLYGFNEPGQSIGTDETLVGSAYPYILPDSSPLASFKFHQISSGI